MPDSITDDMLREFAKIGGWAFSKCQLGHAEHCWFVADRPGHYNRPPDFLTDLQACFDVLERFCSTMVFLWECGSRVITADCDERYYCLIQRQIDQSEEPWELVTKANTKQAAIIKAVLSVGKEKG